MTGDIIDGYQVPSAEEIAEHVRLPLTGPILVEALQRAGIEPDDWNNKDDIGWEHKPATTTETRFMLHYHPEQNRWEVTRSDHWEPVS